MKLIIKFFFISFLFVLIFRYSIGISRAQIIDRAYNFLKSNDLENFKDYLDVMQLDIEHLNDTEKNQLNFLYGIYYFRTNDYNQAIEYFKKSTDAFPSEANYYLNRCYLYTQKEISQIEVKPDIFDLIEMPKQPKKIAGIDKFEKTNILKRNYIRVLITNAARLTLELPENTKILDETDNLITTIKDNTKITITAKSSNFFKVSDLGDYSFIKIAPQSYLKINDNIYKYPLELKTNGKSQNILAILEVPLENYLKYVVPKEISANWPIEMIKAQSIAARTYAVYQILTTDHLPFDVKSDQTSQVFGDSKSRRKVTDDAVDATTGIIMTYGGSPIAAFFYSDSGGATEEPHIIWGGKKYPYFKTEIDEFAPPVSHSKWKYTVKESTLRKTIENLKKTNIGRIQKIYPIRTTKNGRWIELAVECSENKITKVDAYALRIALGSQYNFKSLLITDFYQSGDSFTFEGLGFGHGVGLPQWSGKRMAEANYSYSDILRRYYKGIDFATLVYD
ncbi:MAG TPA: SpoIID/LytB domain-containing protein [bacterium]|nr:SpoIID/LytB domain-containing protein [bacterium]